MVLLDVGLLPARYWFLAACLGRLVCLLLFCLVCVSLVCLVEFCGLLIVAFALFRFDYEFVIVVFMLGGLGGCVLLGLGGGCYFV